MARRFGEIGGRELKNQALLRSLIEKHGVDDGYAIFNTERKTLTKSNWWPQGGRSPKLAG